MHRLHRILPVQPLHNFKNTPLSRFFPSPAAGADQNSLIPTNRPATNSSTNSLGTFSILTSSERLRDPISLSPKKSQLHIFRMHDIPQFMSLPNTNFLVYQTLFCFRQLKQNLVSNCVLVQTKIIYSQIVLTFKNTSRAS